jgi:gamma-glutamylcyclotransferase (GGCT)/AIG2-like uncharacterized protein YtfP
MTADADKMLCLLTQRKIINAQVYGSLSLGLSVQITGLQVLVRNTIEDDRAWLLKHYPGGTEQRNVIGHVERRQIRRRARSERFDQMEYRALLRAEEGRHDYTPTFEMWTHVPHECASFRGWVDRDSKPHWTCFHCGKVTSITKARELGLLPPLVRKRTH